MLKAKRLRGLKLPQPQTRAGKLFAKFYTSGILVFIVYFSLIYLAIRWNEALNNHGFLVFGLTFASLAHLANSRHGWPLLAFIEEPWGSKDHKSGMALFFLLIFISITMMAGQILQWIFLLF